jgi:antitoxin (DNA-binding transcriptional repressor) of toxin-antitoxin stability system
VERLPQRVSATQVSRSFSRILDRVETGARFVVHRHGKDVCLMAAPPLGSRTAAQCLDILQGRAPVQLDARFGDDLLAILAAETTDTSPWDS